MTYAGHHQYAPKEKQEDIRQAMEAAKLDNPNNMHGGWQAAPPAQCTHAEHITGVVLVQTNNLPVLSFVVQSLHGAACAARQTSCKHKCKTMRDD